MRVLSAVAITPGPPPGRAQVGHAWDLDGSGAAGPVTVFARPIQVVLRYGGADPEFLFYWDGAAWDALPTTVDRAAHIATASVPHLTVFAAFTAMGASSSGGGSGAAVAVAVIVALAVAIGVIAVAARRRGRAEP